MDSFEANQMECFDCGKKLTDEEIRQFSLDPDFRVNSRFDERKGCVPLCDECFTTPHTPPILSDDEDEEEEEEEDEEEEEEEDEKVYCEECGQLVYDSQEDDYSDDDIIPLCEECAMNQ